MPPFNVGQFRTSFPEFSDTVAYPDSQIEFWAGLASQQVRPNIWGGCWFRGVSLYVAHEITISALNVKSAQAGGAPGTSGGIANTKTVGSATIGYDTTSTAEKDAGHWNMTSYGKQFIRLVRIFGAAAIQL
jgi:hypothetical protein